MLEMLAAVRKHTSNPAIIAGRSGSGLGLGPAIVAALADPAMDQSRSSADLDPNLTREDSFDFDY